MAETAKTKLLKRAWIAAFAQGEVEVTCKDRKEAHRLRFAFYNAVKTVRDGTCLDRELKVAVEGCTLVVEDEGLKLVIRRFDKDRALQDLASQLGLPLEDLKEEAPKTQIDTDIDNSKAAMLLRMQKGQV